MTKITHNFVPITRAVALNSKWGLWSPDCIDEGLCKLVQSWVDISAQQYQNDCKKEKPLNIQQEMMVTLAIFTIHQDKKSVLHGKKVMKGFSSTCFHIKDPLQPTDDSAEVCEQEDKYAA